MNRDEGRSVNRLTAAEIESGFRLTDSSPVLTVREAAALLRISESTLYHRVSRGEFRSAINGRGKPLRFWRDRLVKEFFSPRPRNRSTPRNRSSTRPPNENPSGGGGPGGNGGWR